MPTSPRRLQGAFLPRAPAAASPIRARQRHEEAAAAAGGGRDADAPAAELHRAAHNEFGARLAEILNDALVTAFIGTDYQQRIEDFGIDHQLIMDYLENRDADGVKLAMNLHLKNSIKIYHLT